jgi:hypothetical protein
VQHRNAVASQSHRISADQSRRAHDAAAVRIVVFSGNARRDAEGTAGASDEA